MAVVNPGVNPGSPASKSRMVNGNMPLRYYRVTMSGTVVETTDWLSTDDAELIEVQVKGADANNAVQIYGTTRNVDGTNPSSGSTQGPIGAAITADAHEYIQPWPERLKVDRTTTNGGTVEVVINIYLRARKTGSR